ncbi:MAG: cardiolipin synthase [Anaerorhabdus sp.]
MRKILSVLTKRHVIVGLLILIQLIFMISLIYQLSEYVIRLNQLLTAFSIIVVIYLINQDLNPSYKLAWSILILTFPIFGGFFYLLFGNKKAPKALRRSMLSSIQKTLPLLSQDHSVLAEIEEQSKDGANQFKYVLKNSYFPVYRNTKLAYFKLGEEKFKALVEELKKAEHFIFLEYFIIEEGLFWNTILEILEQKVKDGVQVRITFDDAGCVQTLPYNYKQQLEKKGIACCVFNPLRARLVVQMNNRDHRKIAVIDNRVAFVGGINLADEYINEVERFGHWKDTAMMLQGDAVWSFTVMFLQFWHYLSKGEEQEYLSYKLDHGIQGDDGYIQPFSDTPTDDEEVGLNVHMNLINKAKKSIYIHTPYLIIGYEMQKALILAAKSGVDVRMTLPHIPDKWYVHLVSQANYRKLIEAGVRIYEYTPGFIHSKIILVDDDLGFIGTINMDYRSYYLHYECGVIVYKDQVLSEMKNDYVQTLAQCQEITKEDMEKTSFGKKLVQALLNLFSPLM